MKKLLLLFFILIHGTTFACEKYVIGFKGLRNIFDNQAFIEYTVKKQSCYKLFSHTEINSAVKFISILKVPYQLYGYSAGAASVGQTLSLLNKNKITMPEYVITIGAYKTTDVNFNRYGIKYDNYFDESGQGQKGPGTMISNVGHDKIQKFIVGSLD
jgi:hypothetical protein